MTTFTDPDEMLAKVKSGSKGTYDMIIGPAQDINILKSQDLIQKLDTSKIDNFKILMSNIYMKQMILKMNTVFLIWVQAY